MDKQYQAISGRLIWKATTATLNAISPDVVVVNGYSFPEALAAICWANDRRRGIVLASDSRSEDHQRSVWKEFLKRRVVGACTCAHVAGSQSASYLIQLGMAADRLYYCTDCVDNEFYDYSREPGLQPPRDEQVSPYFIAVSRFIPKKGLVHLIEEYRAYADACDGVPWRLMIVGDGPLREKLEVTASSLERGNVEFPGFLNPDQLRARYINASCFVHPSEQDTWGLVVNEAMAASLPVIVSDGAGCAVDLVKQGLNGWIVGANTGGEIASAMSRMHQMPPEDRAGMGAVSRSVIADWGLSRYAQELHAACGRSVELAKSIKTRLGVADSMLLRSLATLVR
ncbi:glycosyltransferase family 4 protein [Candidatus Laterigemmans baculatus]|uniref:glycosyltransferase family 4 protein n=1 Tax=Candidatus Laterigemmans baculatus TaxID=2770505 RepID=UPI0013DA1EB0|nr:glycosyltransferase family 4 protein [Candidatus Laterigemmans baculatus]